MPSSRIVRERRTVEAMIRLYCHDRHGTRAEVCAECQSLMDYAGERLAKCPFQEGKTTCGNCRVHCYKPEMRERAREMMRTAGPRMPLRHPLLTLWHFLDGRRKEPVKKKEKKE